MDILCAFAIIKTYCETQGVSCGNCIFKSEPNEFRQTYCAFTEVSPCNIQLCFNNETGEVKWKND